MMSHRRSLINREPYVVFPQFNGVSKGENLEALSGLARANLLTLSTPIGGVAVTGEKQWDMEFFVRIFDSKHNVHPRVKRLNIDPGKILVSCELQPVKPLFSMSCLVAGEIRPFSSVIAVLKLRQQSASHWLRVTSPGSRTPPSCVQDMGAYFWHTNLSSRR